MPFEWLILACLFYVGFLFAVAFAVDRRVARGGAPGWMRSPLVYTLSLSIYCTAWTFYGAVGYAARSGLEFLTIYLGPTLVFAAWWGLLRKMLRTGKAQRVTSIGDFLSARYGKSAGLAVAVTVLCVIAATPYIALQLQSLALSVAVFAEPDPSGALPAPGATAFWVAAGLALFTILFGTRNLDADEQHFGIVIAIAIEAVVKMIALLAVGVFVVWGLGGGLGPTIDRIAASPLATWTLRPDRWVGLVFVSAAAILCLPRMFQVMVVENSDQRHLATAAWAFPAYLMLMSLFVVPIAVTGLAQMPEGSDPDLFVLTLPLASGHGEIAMLAFLGGFSSATSMVIVAAIALATMVSNHIVVPLWLRLATRQGGAAPGDLGRVVLRARRASIVAVVALGYGYYAAARDSAGLAATGLIAFVGVAQMLPALIGGLYWRGATRSGALAGVSMGFATWLFTLYLPSFGEGAVLPAQVFAEGAFGLGWLRPRALFGIEGMDPLVHAIFWSVLLNLGMFCAVSLLSVQGPVERMQAARFVDDQDQAPGGLRRGWQAARPEAEALLVLAQRVLGAEAALAFFRAAAARQGKDGYLPDITPAIMGALERRLAGSVGSATAHAMLAQATGATSVSVEDLLAMADETQRIKEQSTRLKAQSDELARTASQLRAANEKLRQMSAQKDAFLGQISHELRTPMTSIRAFSEIISEPDAPEGLRAQYGGIINTEARRLTRLLDDLLDLSVLEAGAGQLTLGRERLDAILDRALTAAGATRPERDFALVRDRAAEAAIEVTTDIDRLSQVFINVISNARKYCDAASAVLRIEANLAAGRIQVDFIDNGTGIPPQAQAMIFEKFARLEDPTRAGGAGLGLAICREIMLRLGGEIAYLPGRGGAAFRVSLPLVALAQSHPSQALPPAGP